MKPIPPHSSPFIYLAFFVTLLTSGFASADAEREILLNVSPAKMDAIIIASGPDGATCGCFVGEDGLAAFHLLAFATPKAPESYLLKSGEHLQAPTLRWISAELGIAIVKFDYKPKVIVEPSAEALEMGTQLAILDPQVGGPVAIGPVTQITKGIVANCRQRNYTPEFSVGAGLPVGGNNMITIGSPIIDSDGKLRGIYFSRRNLGSGQTILNGVATEHWFDGIAGARASAESIKIPLPPELSPYDPASAHPDFRKAVVASSANNFADGIKHVRIALKVHPNSPLLRYLHFDIANLAGMTDELIAIVEATKPAPGAGVAEQVGYLSSLAKALGRTGDQVGAGEALRKGLAIAPIEAHGIREEYSQWCEREGRLDDALRYIREASDATPANILFLERQANLLGLLNRWDEEAKVTKRISELEKLYRPTSSSELRCKKR